MKLYLLNEVEFGDCDSYDAHLVRAESKEAARAKANTHTGSEGKIWEDPHSSTCIEVTPEGEEAILISSFNAG